MTDRQLRCFLALYETLNFSAAARQLFLTQPTLSYQIRTLEEELGTPLFVRTTCRVEPTRAGQLFAEFAQSTRKGYEAFQAALAAGQTVCFESCDAVFVSIVRRCMEEVPMRWLMVPSFEKEYVRMLAGKCLFFSPVRGHSYPREWFHALMFPFPPMPTCLFTRRNDTRPEIHTLKTLALAEHARAVEDGRL